MNTMPCTCHQLSLYHNLAVQNTTQFSCPKHYIIQLSKTLHVHQHVHVSQFGCPKHYTPACQCPTIWLSKTLHTSMSVYQFGCPKHHTPTCQCTTTPVSKTQQQSNLHFSLNCFNHWVSEAQCIDKTNLTKQAPGKSTVVPPAVWRTH